MKTATSWSNPKTDIARVVKPIERAISDGQITSLAETLLQLAAAGYFDHERFFAPPRSDRYTRRLIWKDRQARFVALGMTWQPGQSSPLHDHAGLWGAEIVVRGVMHETTFRLLDRDSRNRYHFAKEVDRFMPERTVSILNPPLEYHDFGNRGAEIAHTIHVYGGDLERSQMFLEETDGWWSARSVEFSYD